MRSLLLEASCVCVMLALCLCSGAFMRFCYFDREFGVTLLRIALANGRRHSAWQGECKASWGNTFTGGGIPPRAAPPPLCGLLPSLSRHRNELPSTRVCCIGVVLRLVISNWVIK